MKIYSKENVISSVNAMIRTGRLPHAFLLFGERGTGKKTLAEYIAMLMLCENGTACGACRHCRRIHANTHPDVIRPERSGKSLIYRRETVRDICSDAFIRPNDCDRKIYIFADCENMEEGTQNLMLKLIEEPPDHAYFIFTASGKSAFLPTILSRVIALGVSECSEQECREALADMGRYSAEQIDEAVSCFHGNIGSCIDYLDGKDIASYVEITKKIVGGIISGDEYIILKALNDIGDNREKIKEILSMTDKVVRDGCILRLNSEGNSIRLTGCYPHGAELLSQGMSFRRAQAVHEALCSAVHQCESNVNTSAAMSALCGMLAG